MLFDVLLNDWFDVMFVLLIVVYWLVGVYLVGSVGLVLGVVDLYV